MFGCGRARRQVLVALTIIGVVALSPSVAGAQGNSEAAHACQQGGYLNYTDADGTLFKNAGQCTRYVAQGGTLVPIPRPDLSLEGNVLIATGFTPNTELVEWRRTYSPSGRIFLSQHPGTTDGNGSITLTFIPCHDLSNTGVEMTIRDAAGVSYTEYFPLSCGG